MTGKQLRRLRLDRGMSVSKAAKLVGVSHRTWVRWESIPKIPATAAKIVHLLAELRRLRKLIADWNATYSHDQADVFMVDEELRLIAAAKEIGEDY